MREDDRELSREVDLLQLVGCFVLRLFFFCGLWRACFRRSHTIGLGSL
jgi:hypothetical protein